MAEVSVGGNTKNQVEVINSNAEYYSNKAAGYAEDAKRYRDEAKSYAESAAASVASIGTAVDDGLAVIALAVANAERDVGEYEIAAIERINEILGNILGED